MRPDPHSDTLEIELTLWDERPNVVRRRGVGVLEDKRTRECDGVIRCPALNDGQRLGHAVVHTDDDETLRFNAMDVDQRDG